MTLYSIAMTNPLPAQITKLRQIITAPETLTSYQQVVAVTWTILKETAVLLWLVLCLVLVAADWFWTNSVLIGRKARAWVNSFDLEQTDSNQMASQMGQTIVTAGKSSLDYAIAQAREQLGLPTKPEVAVPPAVSPAAPKPAAPAPVQPIAPAQSEELP
jgi:hypothetical protein